MALKGGGRLGCISLCGDEKEARVQGGCVYYLGSRLEPQRFLQQQLQLSSDSVCATSH